jgi:hypothetical protein
MGLWATRHVLLAATPVAAWVGFATPAVCANLAVTDALTFVSPGTVYVRDLVASANTTELISAPGTSIGAGSALYAAKADIGSGTFQALSIYPNYGAGAGTGPIVDPTFIWGGPGTLTFKAGDWSAHIDGTYHYSATPGAGFGAAVSASLGVDGLPVSETFSQGTIVENDATGAVKLASASAACSPPGNCAIAHDDVYGVDATFWLPAFTVAADTPFQISVALFTDGTGGPMTEDFFHTESLSLLLPAGVAFVNDSGVPVDWVAATSATPVPEPLPVLVMLSALTALTMLRRRPKRNR